MVKATPTVDSKRSKSPEIPPAIQYRLSDDTFLLLGWTTKPNISLAFPVVTMKARFAHPVISPWFQPRDENLTVKYRNGKRAYFANKDGTGMIYYPTGKLAAKIVKGGRDKERTRIWVYDSGETDLDGMKHSRQLCAIFDSLGNGVVYDRHMRKRLVYNQTEGILVDSTIKTPVIWKWHNIPFTGSVSFMDDEDEKSLKKDENPKEVSYIATPVKMADSAEGLNTANSSGTSVKTVASKTEPEFEDPADELKYIDTGRLLPLEVSPIKPIVFRINKYFSLRIFSQSEISLSFFADGLHTQLKIGVLYNPYDKLKVTEIDDPSVFFERVLCPFESFPAKTGSLLKFKKFLHKKRTNGGHVPPLLSI